MHFLQHKGKQAGVFGKEGLQKCKFQSVICSCLPPDVTFFFLINTILWPENEHHILSMMDTVATLYLINQAIV